MPARRALIARASRARDVLADALRARGAEVDVLALYETIAEPLAGSYARGRAKRRLHHLHLLLDGALLPRCAARRGAAEDGAEVATPRASPRRSTRIVSIGPVTSQTLRENGLEPQLEAERHDIDGVIDALLIDATRGGRR